jgi:hypothetical protein
LFIRKHQDEQNMYIPSRKLSIMGNQNAIKSKSPIYPSESSADPKNILIWINTFERPQELSVLLNDIHQSTHDFNIKILVMDDNSKVDYTESINRFSGKLNISFMKMTSNHGKKLYWRLCNTALSYIQKLESNYKYFIKIDDDFRLVDNFFQRCINVWESIQDFRKIGLNFVVDDRLEKTNWSKFKPQLTQFSKIDVYKTQWIDMNFFCTRSLFQVLEYRIREQSPLRWAKNEKASSGVGRDITSRVLTQGYNLYMSTESLAIHDHHESKMNPEERRDNPLITRQSPILTTD